MRGKELHKIFPALGTVNALTLYDSFAPEIAEQVKKRVLDLHRRFSLILHGIHGVCSGFWFQEIFRSFPQPYQLWVLQRF